MPPVFLFIWFEKSILHHFDEVNHAVGITPFVVVPRHDLHHLTHHHGALGIEDAAVWVVDDVAAHDRVLSVFEHTLHRAFGGFLHGSVDLFLRGFGLQRADKVDK